MKLRSIPPKTALKHTRLARGSSSVSSINRVSKWQPKVLETKARRRPKMEVTQHDVDVEIAKHIARLTEEIELWLPEFGEDALLLLYEERARWAESM